MRQHNFIFDVDNNMVGIARATCNYDENQVKYEEELVLANQKIDLGPYIDQIGQEVRKPRGKHDPEP